MGILKIGDIVEDANEEGVIGIFDKVINGNINHYYIELEDGVLLMCTEIKHVTKQRQLEAKMCRAAGIPFKI